MSWNWGGGMAEQRITKATDDAALAWLKRQDEEMEREREINSTNWPIILSIFLSLLGWTVIGTLIWLIAKAVSQ